MTTLDPNNKSSTETLSAGNLTATSSGVGTAAATRKFTSPQAYFEGKPSTLTGNVAIGIVNSAYNMAAGTLMGANANGVGFRQGGAVVINGTTISTIFTYASTDTIGVAVDLQRQLVWFTKNGTSWNNDILANQNPVGAVGGISIASAAQGGFLPAIGGDTTGAVWNVVFASASFAYSPPTGFSSVDACNVSAKNVSVGNGAAFSVIGPVAYEGLSSPSAGARALGLMIGRQLNGAPYGGQYTSSRHGQSISAATVEESGVPVAGKEVRCFDSVTREFLGFGVSDGAGHVTIPTLGRALVDAYARDDPNYDGIVHVRITPGP